MHQLELVGEQAQLVPNSPAYRRQGNPQACTKPTQTESGAALKGTAHAPQSRGSELVGLAPVRAVLHAARFPEGPCLPRNEEGVRYSPPAQLPSQGPTCTGSRTQLPEQLNCPNPKFEGPDHSVKNNKKG